MLVWEVTVATQNRLSHHNNDAGDMECIFQFNSLELLNMCDQQHKKISRSPADPAKSEISMCIRSLSSQTGN